MSNSAKIWYNASLFVIYKVNVRLNKIKYNYKSQKTSSELQIKCIGAHLDYNLFHLELIPR